MLNSFLGVVSFQFLTVSCGFEHHLIKGVIQGLYNQQVVVKTWMQP